MSAVPTSAEEARELFEDVQRQLKDLRSWRQGISAWKDATNERIEEVESENEALRQRLEAVESRLEILEDSSDGGRDAKVRDICEYALDAKGTGNGVALKAKEIAGAASVSRRYAYDLIDELPKDHHFLLTLQEARQNQYGSLELDADSYDSALVVDCEALQSDPGAVNKFTTRNSQEGGSE